eukprot:CAMPEP_0197528206 /NCGR_PEP_ID=MMETSP1318-20131121/24260_1 /TAXON_ID=552666 /ORGANISM="Partenskyella glossopodia, Strain RCC365" /LENGTH=165 /DNA_ID=CAMNT_0043083203 /DNA_START=88 /DNA_END=585 /DNA_ORIENTATION=+
MGVLSAPEDKPKIVFHAAMMAIQNFGFFMMYYDIWGATPAGDTCSDTRFWCAFMSLTCFYVAFICVGMGYGGYTDDGVIFPLYWFLHLAGGACYTVCTIGLPVTRFSDEGKDCATLSPVNGDRLEAVIIMHISLYLVYVGSMLSITYFSYIKSTFYAGNPPQQVE